MFTFSDNTNEKLANESHYKKSQLARMNKTSLYELLEKHNRNICNIEHITKLDMIDCLLEIENEQGVNNVIN